MTPAPQIPEIGKEYPPSGEETAIQQLRTLHLQIQHATGADSRRGEHPKTHCGVWAKFQVEEDIPSEFRAGIFAKPATYTSLVRYSNGRSADDRLADVRGMAVKVLIPGDGDSPFQQDFILANHPVFFARNVEHVFEFLAATASGTPPAQLAMTTHPALIGFTGVVKTSLLELTYWSQTPYRLRDGAVKYLLLPSPDANETAISPDSPDFLREAVADQLTARKVPAIFHFCVNPQTDAVAMPIEDPTVEWKSGPVKLATISIFPQKFDSPEQNAFVENLVWTPWNSLPEHAALGGINRARKPVYEDSRDIRHKTSGASIPVITGREWF